MKNEHRVGVRIKRHRDLRHDKIMDFLDNLPRDENTGEIMKTTLSNHTINALYMYARILAGEVTVIEKTTPDPLTAMTMQVMTGQATPLLKQEVSTRIEDVHEPKNNPVMSQVVSMPEQTLETVELPVPDEGKNSVVVEQTKVSAKEEVPQIRTQRPRFGKSLGGG